MRVVLVDSSASLETRDWCMLILPCAHCVDSVALVVNHFLCGERAAWRAIVPFDELACLHASLELRFNLRNRGVTHRTFQCIPQYLTLLGHRVTLQIFLSRVGT